MEYTPWIESTCIRVFEGTGYNILAVKSILISRYQHLRRSTKLCKTFDFKLQQIDVVWSSKRKAFVGTGCDVDSVVFIDTNRFELSSSR